MKKNLGVAMLLVSLLASCAADPVAPAAEARDPESESPPADITSGSFINVGLTVESGGFIKGSGSMHNTGDYSTVCVVLVGQFTKPGSFPSDVSKKCHNEIGDLAWSAPDVRKPVSGCEIFKTEVRAFVNGSRVQTLPSNTITSCP